MSRHLVVPADVSAERIRVGGRVVADGEVKPRIRFKTTEVREVERLDEKW